MTATYHQDIRHGDRDAVLAAFDTVTGELAEAYADRYGGDPDIDRADTAVEIDPGRDGGVAAGQEYAASVDGRRGAFRVAVHDRDDADGAVRRDIVLDYRAGDQALFDRLGEAAADVLDGSRQVDVDTGSTYRFGFERAALPAPR